MEDKAELAKSLFRQGYNCSQAVVLAFLDETGMDKAEAMRLFSSFGGGMGRLREVCGSVSAMFAVAGLLYGSEDTDVIKKRDHYALIQSLAQKFKDKNGSIVCKELLGVPGVQPPTPQARTDDYYKKRPCPELIGDAARILQELIEERGTNK